MPSRGRVGDGPLGTVVQRMFIVTQALAVLQRYRSTPTIYVSTYVPADRDVGRTKANVMI